MHPPWGCPPPSGGEAAAVGGEAMPCSPGAAERPKSALLGGTRGVAPPSMAATPWVPGLRRGHIRGWGNLGGFVKGLEKKVQKRGHV